MRGWWERTLGRPLRKTVWRVLKTEKRELPDDPAVPLVGVPRGHGIGISKTGHPRSRQPDSQQPRYVDELDVGCGRMGKESVRPRRGVSSGFRKTEALPSGVAEMDLEDVMLSPRSHQGSQRRCDWTGETSGRVEPQEAERRVEVAGLREARGEVTARRHRVSVVRARGTPRIRSAALGYRRQHVLCAQNVPRQGISRCAFCPHANESGAHRHSSDGNGREAGATLGGDAGVCGLHGVVMAPML